MEDFPRTVSEFEARFVTEDACRAYVAALRWPDGFRCPRCRGTDAWHTARGLWVCRACSRHTSVTVGTIFQDTRLPLRTWFRAMWWICSQKTGVSALGLQRLLGLGSYETAWALLHKLRRAMVRPGRDRLAGGVEVDETYIGGERPGKHGRGAAGKTLVLVAAEVDGPAIGRIRLGRTLALTAPRVERFVARSVAAGSLVRTDGLHAYAGLAALGYRHQVTLMKRAGGDPERMLPRVHRVVALLKRWWLGTHQGAVQPHQLDSYLDEFTFRFNRRRSRSRGKLFYRLVEQAVMVAPAPYELLIDPRRGVEPHR